MAARENKSLILLDVQDDHLVDVQMFAGSPAPVNPTHSAGPPKEVKKYEIQTVLKGGELVT